MRVRSPDELGQGVEVEREGWDGGLLVTSCWGRLGRTRAGRNRTRAVEERSVDGSSTHKDKIARSDWPVGGSNVTTTRGGYPEAPARPSNYLSSTIRQFHHPLLLIMTIFAAQPQPRVPLNHGHNAGHRDQGSDMDSEVFQTCDCYTNFRSGLQSVCRRSISSHFIKIYQHWSVQLCVFLTMVFFNRPRFDRTKTITDTTLDFS